MNLRPATKSDIADICKLADMASSYMFEFLFHDTLPDMNYFEVMQYSVLHSDIKFCYQNCIIAEDEQQNTMGVTCYFPPNEYKRSDNELSIIPQERIKHLEPLYKTAVPDAFVLYVLAVYPEYRKQSVASELLEHVKQEAKLQGFNTCCLDVWADSQNAVEFYKKRGFEIVAQGSVPPHELIRHCGEFKVMKCDLI